MLNVETGERLRVGQGLMEATAVSADGNQVAYGTASGGVYELRVSAFSRLREAPGRVLLRNEAFNYNVPFGWGADDREVSAVLSRPDDANVIAAIPLAGGPPRPIKSLDW